MGVEHPGPGDSLPGSLESLPGVSGSVHWPLLSAHMSSAQMWLGAGAGLWVPLWETGSNVLFLFLADLGKWLPTLASVFSSEVLGFLSFLSIPELMIPTAFSLFCHRTGPTKRHGSGCGTSFLA